MDPIEAGMYVTFMQVRHEGVPLLVAHRAVHTTKVYHEGTCISATRTENNRVPSNLLIVVALLADSPMIMMMMMMMMMLMMMMMMMMMIMMMMMMMIC